MQEVHFPTLDPLAHLFTVKNSSAFPTSNSPLSLALSATSPPKSLKTQAMETPWISGGRVSSLSGELQVHFSLCTAFPSAVAPLPFPWQNHNSHLAKVRSQNRVCRTGALFPIEIKPNPLSDVSLPLVRSIVVPRRLYATLGLPLPTRHPTLISPPLSDKIGALEQSGLCLDWRQGHQQVYLICCFCEPLEHAK